MNEKEGPIEEERKSMKGQRDPLNDSQISSGRGRLPSMHLSALQLQVMKSSKEYQEMLMQSNSLKIFDLRKEEDYYQDAEEVDMGKCEEDADEGGDGMIFDK
jgi:hypothetical protein